IRGWAVNLHDTTPTAFLCPCSGQPGNVKTDKRSLGIAAKVKLRGYPKSPSPLYSGARGAFRTGTNGVRCSTRPKPAGRGAVLTATPCRQRPLRRVLVRS